MDKEKVKSFFEKNKKIILGGCAVVLGVGIFVGVMMSSDGSVSMKFKSSLDNLQESSDLETVTYRYDIIAKKCNNDKKCNMKSNNIKDFEFVVSCESSITASIKFDNIKVHENDKKLIVTLPKADLGDPVIDSVNFLNVVPGEKFESARKICAEEVKKRSLSDIEFNEAIKDHTADVIKNYFEQWIKALDMEDYTIEVR